MNINHRESCGRCHQSPCACTRITHEEARELLQFCCFRPHSEKTPERFARLGVYVAQCEASESAPSNTVSMAEHEATKQDLANALGALRKLARWCRDNYLHDKGLPEALHEAEEMFRGESYGDSGDAYKSVALRRAEKAEAQLIALAALASELGLPPGTSSATDVRNAVNARLAAQQAEHEAALKEVHGYRVVVAEAALAAQREHEAKLTSLQAEHEARIEEESTRAAEWMDTADKRLRQLTSLQAEHERALTTERARAEEAERKLAVAVDDCAFAVTGREALKTELAAANARLGRLEEALQKSLAAAARRIGELEEAIADVADGFEQQGKLGLASQLRQFLPPVTAPQASTEQTSPSPAAGNPHSGSSFESAFTADELAEIQPAKPRRKSGPSLTTAERRANGLSLLQGLWLPSELLARVDAECERRGLRRTALVRAALEEWLESS